VRARLDSCGSSLRQCVKAAGSRRASIRRNRSASRCRVRICACDRCRWDRWPCSAPATSRRHDAQAPGAHGRPADRDAADGRRGSRGRPHAFARSRAQGRAGARQWLPDRCRSGARDGARRSIPGNFRWSLYLGGYACDSALSSARLLSGFPRGSKKPRGPRPGTTPSGAGSARGRRGNAARPGLPTPLRRSLHRGVDRLLRIDQRAPAIGGLVRRVADHRDHLGRLERRVDCENLAREIRDLR
jgi:hypothetical protein